MEGSQPKIQKSQEERPEELIVEIYRQKSEHFRAGLKASQVIMSQKTWRIIRAYHSSLGILEGNLPDYIGEDSIFGLDVMLDGREGIRVK